MAFTVDDLKEFLAALRDHPEWRDQVRDEIMAEDMRALPGIVRQLGERMDQLTDRVGELALRLDQLTDRVGELTLRLDQLTDRLEQLTTNVNAGFNDLRGRVGNL